MGKSVKGKGTITSEISGIYDKYSGGEISKDELGERIFPYLENLAAYYFQKAIKDGFGENDGVFSTIITKEEILSDLAYNFVRSIDRFDPSKNVTFGTFFFKRAIFSIFNVYRAILGRSKNCHVFNATGGREGCPRSFSLDNPKPHITFLFDNIVSRDRTTSYGAFKLGKAVDASMGTTVVIATGNVLRRLKDGHKLWGGWFILHYCGDVTLADIARKNGVTLAYIHQKVKSIKEKIKIECKRLDREGSFINV